MDDVAKEPREKKGRKIGRGEAERGKTAKKERSQVARRALGGVSF